MDKQVLLRGGPADGETVTIKEGCNQIRIAKIHEAILASENSTMVADCEVPTYAYSATNDDLIFQYNE